MTFDVVEEAGGGIAEKVRGSWLRTNTRSPYVVCADLRGVVFAAPIHTHTTLTRADNPFTSRRADRS
jgi:hypothetical protein